MQTSSAYLKRGVCRRAMLLSLDRPKTPTELAEKTKIKGDYANRIVREFRKLGLIECLNSNEITGRIYRLTIKGKRLRIALCKGVENYQPYREPDKDFDWSAYSKVMRGKQRRAVLLALDASWRTREAIRKKALEINSNIWRPNSYEVINDLLKIKLVEAMQQDDNTYYRLTEVGARIKELLIGPPTS